MNVSEWIQRVPMLLDACGRERKSLREFVVHLASYASADGTDIFPSINRVAEELNAHRRTVIRLYREAEEAKLIIPDGKSSRDTRRVRLNFDYPFDMGWLPARQIKIDRRAKTAERVRRHRELKVLERDTTPVTTTLERDTTPVTAETGNGGTATQPLSVDQQEEHPHPSTAAAGASPAGADVIDAELVDDDLPGPSGPPLLALDPPSTSLAVRASDAPAPVADLSASWLLPEPDHAGKSQRKRSAPIDAPRFDAEAWQLPREPRTPSAWVHELVGRYVDAARGFGFEPSKRQISQVGKEVRGLVAAGNNPHHVLAAVRRAAEKRGAWVMRAMADVQPGNWAALRPGKQVVTSRGVVTLPEGATNGHRRLLGIADAFGLTPTK